LPAYTARIFTTNDLNRLLSGKNYAHPPEELLRWVQLVPISTCMKLHVEETEEKITINGMSMVNQVPRLRKPKL
jgi:hypothetical protein